VNGHKPRSIPLSVTTVVQIRKISTRKRACDMFLGMLIRHQHPRRGNLGGQAANPGSLSREDLEIAASQESSEK
jgi:hypothetical protein